MKEIVNLRCCKCNHKFSRTLDVRDNVSDIKCQCGSNHVEIDLGNQPRVEKVKDNYEGEN
jgi:Zn finger protein HypA/HybF involved in hydrogenase expression